VDGRLAAPRGRVVEAREIVMHERGAVQQLDRRSGRVGERLVVAAAGLRDRKAQPGPDPLPAGKDRMPDRCRETRGGAERFRPSDRCR
jgi:hypothetical protein